MKSTLAVVAIAAAIGIAPGTTIASAEHDKHHTAKPADGEKKPEMIDAEVRKIDLDAKKITLKHGAIKSLDMPAMTMVFQVKDTKLLDNVKPGDKVKVNVEQTKSGYAVTNIESAK